MKFDLKYIFLKKFKFKNNFFEDNFNYYVDVRMSLRNQSNELWWDVSDDYNKENDYNPPCNFIFIVF